MNQLQKRIVQHIETLAKVTSTPGEGVTRVVYTKEDEKAKTYIKQQMQDLSLQIREDEVGNIFATWEGTADAKQAVWTGSHIDAPTNGGKYDGVVGVIGALEAIRLLQSKGYEPAHDITVIVFTSEEPTRFGVGCLGSRALTGMIHESDLNNWLDDENHSLGQVLTSLGKDPNKVLEEQLDADKIKAFIELHIEQGAVLEEADNTIGIVEIISAPTEFALTIYGEQRHAGSTPMNIRKDPVPAAAEAILLIEKFVKENSQTAVGTVGKMSISPGTSNVIAEKVELSVDIRDIDKAKKDQIINRLKEEINQLIDERGLSYKWEVKADDVPAVMDKGNVEVIKQCAEKLNLSYMHMHSGAYHDALIMSRLVPANMIFIPSEKGISHAPEEYTSIDEIEQGIILLAETLQKLAKK